jgi:hypothetical protein
MKDLNHQIHSGEHASIEMTGRKLHQPKPLVCTLESYDGNLADEMATAFAQPVQCVELPAVAPEEFERLFSWFIS